MCAGSSETPLVLSKVQIVDFRCSLRSRRAWGAFLGGGLTVLPEEDSGRHCPVDALVALKGFVACPACRSWRATLTMSNLPQQSKDRRLGTVGLGAQLFVKLSSAFARSAMAPYWRKEWTPPPNYWEVAWTLPPLPPPPEDSRAALLLLNTFSSEPTCHHADSMQEQPGAQLYLEDKKAHAVRWQHLNS